MSNEKKKTTITIVKDNGYMRVSINGHHKDPIVCSGLSAIIQTCELGLKAIADSYDGVEVSEVNYEQHK